MKKVAIMMIVALFAITGVAAAKGPGGGGPDGATGRGGGNGVRAADGSFWERDRVVETLSLTEGEQAALQELHQAHRAEVQELRDELKEAREELRETMTGEEFSASKARKQFRKAEKIQAKMQEKRFEMELSQREILGHERYAKLQKMEKRIKKRQQQRS